MYLHNSRTLILIAGAVVVCGLGAAALMHRSNAAAPDAGLAQPLAATQPLNYNSYQASVAYPTAEIGYTGSDGYYPSSPRPIFVRQPSRQAIATGYREAPQYTDSTEHRGREVDRDGRAYHRGRSKEHSVEIVAGTAAVGAAIGAIAGGGKGAAIGAVSGGGAGFAYDRMTHNR